MTTILVSPSALTDLHWGIWLAGHLERHHLSLITQTVTGNAGVIIKVIALHGLQLQLRLDSNEGGGGGADGVLGVVLQVVPFPQPANAHLRSTASLTAENTLGNVNLLLVTGNLGGSSAEDWFVFNSDEGSQLDSLGTGFRNFVVRYTAVVPGDGLVGVCQVEQGLSVREARVGSVVKLGADFLPGDHGPVQRVGVNFTSEETSVRIFSQYLYSKISSVRISHLISTALPGSTGVVNTSVRDMIEGG